LTLTEKMTITPIPFFKVSGDVVYTITKQDPTKDEAKSKKEMKHGN